jgi:uncharacterized MAPEG superfamily protein
MVYALRWDAMLVTPLLLFCIWRVTALRLASTNQHTRSGRVTPEVEHARSVLSNTLEQCAVAVPVHVALASYPELERHMAVIPALASLWSASRVLYFWTYREGRAPRFRLVAFALGVVPTTAAVRLRRLYGPGGVACALNMAVNR